MEPPQVRPIAEDARGASWSIYIPDLDAEIVIIYTKKGFFRGGHSHNKKEVSMLLSGKVHYTKRLFPADEIEFDEHPGEVLHNMAGEVHLAEFLENSWLIDWKINTKVGEAVNINDPIYRAKVDEQMKELRHV